MSTALPSGLLPAVETHCPDRPQFSGFMKPTRVEGEVANLEVYGTIPADIDGTFYRVMPDPQFAPFIENDPWFNGDGTPDVCYYRIGADGKFLETVWLVAPVVAMIHDFALTENRFRFPLIPQLCDVERMKQGGEH